MYNKFKKSFLFILISGCSTYKNIKEIYSIDEIKTNLENLDKNSLVLFDVDDTLIIHKDLILQTRFKDTFKNIVKDMYLKEFKPFELLEKSKDTEKIGSITLQQSEWILVEPQSVDIIKNLQNQGIKVIAFTGFSTGSYGIIPSLEEWRFNALLNFGFDFRPAFNIKNIEFKNLPSHRDFYPVFYKGILFANHRTKGEVLGAFLNYLNWTPSQVVLIDDNIEYVRSVADEMKKRNIPFIGYLYLKNIYLHGYLNKELINLQIKNLISKNQWITE